MPDNNFLVALKQLRSEQISGFLVGVLNNSFTGLANAYLLNANLAHLTGVESFIGQKTFLFNPNIPYSGLTGQAISKLFVTDQNTILQNQINLIQNPVFISGQQFISGNKTFFQIIINSGTVTGSFDVPNPVGTGNAVPLGYLNTQINTLINSSFVHLTGNEIVSGVKTFNDGINVPITTGVSGAVNLSQLGVTGQSIIDQFNATGLSLQTQISSIDLTAAASVTGFGGVLSLNAQIGNLFLQGRGNISVAPNGNIINISGAIPNVHSGILIGRANVLSGVDKQFVSYPFNYSNTLKVFTSLVNFSGAPLLVSAVSGESTSGFYALYSNIVDRSGYYLNYQAWDGTGDINVIQGPQGEQGIQGPPPTYSNYNINYFTQTISTGSGVYEQFASQTYFITGLLVGLTQPGSGTPLSGNIYKRDPFTNARTNLIPFTMNDSQFFSGVDLTLSVYYPFFIDNNYRVGIDVMTSISGGRGLSVTMFGYTS